MNEPLKIMDEANTRAGLTPEQGWLVCLPESEWQSLRVALERQAEREAQKDARIARLETGAVLAIQSLRDRWQEGGAALLVASGLQDVVNESPAHNAAGKANEQLQARARIAQQREAEMLEALCEARILIDNFGYALAARVSVGHAAGVRKRMNETLAKIDRLVAERES